MRNKIPDPKNIPVQIKFSTIEFAAFNQLLQDSQFNEKTNFIKFCIFRPNEVLTNLKQIQRQNYIIDKLMRGLLINMTQNDEKKAEVVQFLADLDKKANELYPEG